MNPSESVSGVVLKHRPVGESDWLVTLLTATRGKINAFARGARRPGNRLSGNVEPFCFGTFFLSEGRSSHVITDAKIDRYFEGFRNDLERASYGTFFLEMAEVFSAENMEAKELCNLLYLTLRVMTLEERIHSYPLIRCAFELRLLQIEGVLNAGMAAEGESAEIQQALSHIAKAPLKKLYSFTLSDEALTALCALVNRLRRRHVDRRLLSLEMLAMYEPDLSV